jgi:predicted nucleic acid-binding protein
MIVGIDSNILIYALDPAYPEHNNLRELLVKISPKNRIAINPTILHETYHTLVFSQKWVPSEAARRLKLLLKHPYVEFFSQTKDVCITALNLAERYGLGGRDSLIIANFIMNKVPVIYTHDQEIKNLGKIKWRNFYITFKDPLEKS